MSCLRDVQGTIEGADYYECEQVDELTHEDIDEAIQAALDNLAADPETLRVVAHKREVIDAGERAERLLDDLLLDLDEELGDPNHDSEPTPEMREAALALMRAVVAGFRVWQCEEVGSATVDVAAWRARQA